MITIISKSFILIKKNTENLLFWLKNSQKENRNLKINVPGI